MILEHFHRYRNFWNHWQKPVYKVFFLSYLNITCIYVSFTTTLFSHVTWFDVTSKYAIHELIFIFTSIKNKLFKNRQLF